MRKGEKQVLDFVVEFVDEMLPLFSLSKSDLKWIFKNCMCRRVGRFDQYILRTIRPLLSERLPDPE
jgi:hypothetical protein